MILPRLKSLALVAWLSTIVSSERGPHPRHNPHNIWVTVDAGGDAQTITPSVSGTRTVSGAPEYVTQTSVYTLTTASGMVRTTTGMAPVATAMASSGAGAFYKCGNFQGSDAPFCQPRRGSVLRPGNTYYITWDTIRFSSDDALVAVQVRYSDNTGFTADRNVSASTGFYVWNIDEDVLSQNGRDGTDLNATLSLIEVKTSGNGSDSSLEYDDGPTVMISKSAPSYDASPENRFESRGRTVAIAISVMVSVVLLVLAAFVVWSWKTHGHVFGIGSGTRKNKRDSHQASYRSSFGWPEDKNREVELTHRESWTPTQGRNVFREEIQRQEMQRG
ncbi:hypothetical protein diail_7815, partial [Diaporthe ilicicola]